MSTRAWPAAVPAAPALVGCSHGTSDPVGRRVVRALLDDVRAARPDLEVLEAFVDVQRPSVADVVADVVADGPDEAGEAVVVPLLLSTGYHVGVDIARAVEQGGAAGRSCAAAALGPDPRLVDILVDRLAEVGTRSFDTVVLAAAGSSSPGAARDVAEVAAALRRRRPGPVHVGFGAIARPTVAEAVELARGSSRRVPHPVGSRARIVVASYLLAPGHFHDKLLRSGADAVTAPLAPDPRLARVVLDRYFEACGRR